MSLLTPNDVQNTRLAHCKSCEHMKRGIVNQPVCQKCGCAMNIKVGLKWATCPVGKWGKYES